MNVVYFNFAQMAKRAGQNDVTGRIRPAGLRLPDDAREQRNPKRGNKKGHQTVSRLPLAKHRYI